MSGSSAAITSLWLNGITRSASPAATSTSQVASAGRAASRSWLPIVSTKSVSASTALALIIESARSTSAGEMLCAVGATVLTTGERQRAALRAAVQASAASPLRSCVLGTMAYMDGQPREAEHLLCDALAQVRDDPDSQPMAAMLANRLAGTYTVLSDGQKVMATDEAIASLVDEATPPDIRRAKGAS